LRAALAMLALCATLGASPAAAHQDPFHRLDHLLTEPAAQQSHLGLEVRRLSGEVVYAHHPQRLFTPASVVKLATAFAALRRLGPETRFKTELLATADVADGEMPGDVWLKGYGDPTLRISDLDAFVMALQERGLRRIAGDLIADATLFEGPRHPSGWMWDDLDAGFAAPMSALSLDTNAPSGLVEPPEQRVALRLRERLEQAGILLAGTVRIGAAPAEARVLYRHVSAPVSEIIKDLNKASNNFYAETLIRHLGRLQAAGPLAPGSHAAGMAALDETLDAIGWERGSYRLADGSGLSRYDAVTPSQMTDLLLAAARMPEASVFLASLPVAGVDGTLAARMRGTRAEGVVWAKTGTMSGVSSLCGYVLVPGKEPLAFALMINGFVGSARPVQELQDRLIDALIEAAD
jgi:D-alanyl-D-alanine carboxypeptidase/D-alanyl-D-alanine-endopeptidase (penicillin-binding protein 4)